MLLQLESEKNSAHKAKIVFLSLHPIFGRKTKVLERLLSFAHCYVSGLAIFAIFQLNLARPEFGCINDIQCATQFTFIVSALSKL